MIQAAITDLWKSKHSKGLSVPAADCRNSPNLSPKWRATSRPLPVQNPVPTEISHSSSDAVSPTPIFGIVFQGASITCAWLMLWSGGSLRTLLGLPMRVAKEIPHLGPLQDSHVPVLLDLWHLNLIDSRPALRPGFNKRNKQAVKTTCGYSS